MSAGSRFRAAVAKHKPLQVMGTINAYSALLAERAGVKAIYLSGSGVATASHGLPDLGVTNLHDVAEDVRRITRVTKLPLLVDIDTGFGGAFGIARTIQVLEEAGAAGVHIEDQVAEKRCGHRPGKAIVSQAEMVDRIKACVDARTDKDFVIMARTDALASEGMPAALARSKAYLDAGADMLFPEAFTKLAEYKELVDAVGPDVPILANITEFGKTPLFSRQQLGEVGVGIVLYPLTAWRAMSQAALKIYQTVVETGCQESVIPLMQTRKDLYATIKYHEYEDKLDALFVAKKSKEESKVAESERPAKKAKTKE